jgi:hypothetical protein
MTIARSLSQATSVISPVHVCRRTLQDNLVLILWRPELRKLSQHLGHDAVDFLQLIQLRSFKDYLSISSIFQETMHMLPQVLAIDLGFDAADKIN